MNHLSEEELVLHYYSEEGDSLATERHLDECEECRALYGSLQRVLNVVDTLPVPVRGPEYGTQVWRRIEKQLPARRRLWLLPSPWRWAGMAAALASLLVVAFLAGRTYQKLRRPAEMAANQHQARERLLLVGVSDYLERTQMVLVELNNANPKGTLDISAEQERAADLVSENRLYRQTAAHNGDTAVTGVLEELERMLVDLAHSPSRMSPEELEKWRQRFDSEGVLFQIRVLQTNVKKQEEPARTLGQPAVRQKL